MIRVQSQPFHVAEEWANLKGSRLDIGGSAFFIGSVRDMNDGNSVTSLTLEHYPGMTEKTLHTLEQEARTRWPALLDLLIIHRYGPLLPGDDIVLVITMSPHRETAFAACTFLMDWLKTKAPFWKLETDGKQAHWISPKSQDQKKAESWD